MNKDGALDLIREVKETLDLLKQPEDIKPVKIKSMLEHLRSALEYVTNDVYNELTPSSARIRNDKIYFPYNQKYNIDRFFQKKLQLFNYSENNIYKLFNSIQDYSTDTNELVMMCNLTNEAKHLKPIALDKEEKVSSVKISVDGLGLVSTDLNSNITFQNCTVNGKKLQDFTYSDGQLKTTGIGIPVNLTITKDKKIKFHGVEYEVVPFIERCLNKIEKFVLAVYEELEKTN